MAGLHKIYEELNGSVFPSLGKESFIFKYDEKRRCIDVFQKGGKGSAAFKSIKEPKKGYFKKNDPSFFQRKKFISLDALALKELLPQLNLIMPAKAKDLILHLAESEKAEQEEIKKELGEDFHCEKKVWKDEQGRYKLEIEDGIFITSKNRIPSLRYRQTHEGKQAMNNINAFKGLAMQKFYIRRKKPFFTPFIPTNMLGFRLWGKQQDEVSSVMIDGIDDIIGIMKALELQSQASAALQAFAFYPLAEQAVKMGEEGIADEAEEGAQEVQEIKEAIASYRSSIEEFTIKLQKKKSITKEDIQAHLENMRHLKEKLDEVKGKSVEAFTNQYLGKTGMRLMLASVLSSHLESVINMLGGIKFFSYNGIEAGLSTGIAASEEGILSTLLGGGLGLLGQVSMAIHAGCRAYAEVQEVKKLTKNIKEIKEYKQMSFTFQQMLLEIQKDKRFYKKATAISFTSWSIGQGLTALGGKFILGIEPLALTGLILTILGIGGSAISEKRLSAKYSFNKTPSLLETRIKEYYNNIVCDSLLENLKNRKTSVSRAKKALEEKGYTMELLSFLNMTPLVVNSVFSRGKKAWEKGNISPAQIGFRKSTIHYNRWGRKAQQPLAGLLRDMSGTAKQRIENLFAKCDRTQPLEYMALWNAVVQKLTVDASEMDYLIPIGKLLRQYDRFPLKRVEIIGKISKIPGLPHEFGQKLNKIKIHSYSELVLTIQNCYIESKLNSLGKFNPKEEGKSSSLSKSMLNNPVYQSRFKQDILQKSYVKENRWRPWLRAAHKAKYKEKLPNEVIHIEGTVIKEGGTRRYQKTKEKNVYSLNENALTDNYPAHTPSIKIFDKIFRQTGKRAIRSSYFRAIEEGGNVIKEKQAVDTFKSQIAAL